MSRFNFMEEKEMCQLLDRMTARKEFWHDKVPSAVKFQRFGFQLREADFEQDKTVHHNGFQLRSRNPAAITNSGLSVVKNGKKEFEIRLDVWPFERDDISVLIVPGKYISIKGEHGERDEDGSNVSRKFQRYYHLPKGSIHGSIKCEYFSNKTVVITVPKDGVSDEVSEEIVPINLVSCRNMPLPTDKQYNEEEMPNVQNVSVIYQNEDVIDLRNKVPTATEDSKKEESSKSEGVSETTEDSKIEESSKSEIEPDRQSSEGLSEIAKDSKSEESGIELLSATKDDSKTDQRVN